MVNHCIIACGAYFPSLKRFIVLIKLLFESQKLISWNNFTLSPQSTMQTLGNYIMLISWVIPSNCHTTPTAGFKNTYFRQWA